MTGQGRLTEPPISSLTAFGSSISPIRATKEKFHKYLSRESYAVEAPPFQELSQLTTFARNVFSRSSQKSRW